MNNLGLTIILDREASRVTALDEKDTLIKKLESKKDFSEDNAIYHLNPSTYSIVAKQDSPYVVQTTHEGKPNIPEGQ
ncbi:MAG TPA: hypothetical protein DD414_01465 [Lachnospiraceae bacterium]|nr:hypothetical protein [Lachnospiraceae bacterium]